MSNADEPRGETQENSDAWLAESHGETAAGQKLSAPLEAVVDGLDAFFDANDDDDDDGVHFSSRSERRQSRGVSAAWDGTTMHSSLADDMETSSFVSGAVGMGEPQLQPELRVLLEDETATPAQEVGRRALPAASSNEVYAAVRDELDRPHPDPVTIRRLCSETGLPASLRSKAWPLLLGVHRNVSDLARDLDGVDPKGVSGHSLIRVDALRLKAELSSSGRDDGTPTVSSSDIERLLALFCIRRGCRYSPLLAYLLRPVLLVHPGSLALLFGCFYRLCVRVFGDALVHFSEPGQKNDNDNNNNNNSCERTHMVFRQCLLYHDPELARHLDSIRPGWFRPAITTSSKEESPTSARSAADSPPTPSPPPSPVRSKTPAAEGAIPPSWFPSCLAADLPPRGLLRLWDHLLLGNWFPLAAREAAARSPEASLATLPAAAPADATWGVMQVPDIHSKHDSSRTSLASTPASSSSADGVSAFGKEAVPLMVAVAMLRRARSRLLELGAGVRAPGRPDLIVECVQECPLEYVEEDGVGELWEEAMTLMASTPVSLLGLAEAAVRNESPWTSEDPLSEQGVPFEDHIHGNADDVSAAEQKSTSAASGGSSSTFRKRQIPDPGRPPHAIPCRDAAPLFCNEVLPRLFRGWQRDAGLSGDARLWQLSHPLSPFLVDVRPPSHRARGRIATALHVDTRDWKHDQRPGPGRRLFPAPLTGPDRERVFQAGQTVEGAAWEDCLAALLVFRRQAHIVVMGSGAELLWNFFPRKAWAGAVQRDRDRVQYAVEHLLAAGFPWVGVLQGGFTGVVHTLRRGLGTQVLVGYDPHRCPLRRHIAVTRHLARQRARKLAKEPSRAERGLERLMEVSESSAVSARETAREVFRQILHRSRRGSAATKEGQEERQNEEEEGGDGNAEVLDGPAAQGNDAPAGEESTPRVRSDSGSGGFSRRMEHAAEAAMRRTEQLRQGSKRWFDSIRRFAAVPETAAAPNPTLAPAAAAGGKNSPSSSSPSSSSPSSSSPSSSSSSARAGRRMQPFGPNSAAPLSKEAVRRLRTWRPGMTVDVRPFGTMLQSFPVEEEEQGEETGSGIHVSRTLLLSRSHCAIVMPTDGKKMTVVQCVPLTQLLRLKTSRKKPAVVRLFYRDEEEREQERVFHMPPAHVEALKKAITSNLQGHIPEADA